MKHKLHIDVETYSSVDLKSSGMYKYVESLDFEILMVAYAYGNAPVILIDLAQGQELSKEFLTLLHDPQVEKHAHNAAFERNCFKQIGHNIPIEQWHCTLVKAAYCGLPLSLAMVSEALNLKEEGKLSTGKALIRYFCVPCKPTKANGGRITNQPHHDLVKWEEFKLYCIGDVRAEREIGRQLESYGICPFERKNYLLDQQINDRGLLIDLGLAEAAKKVDTIYLSSIREEMKKLTGLENPNSLPQLKGWLGNATGEIILSLAKDNVSKLIEETEDSAVKRVLGLRQRGSKSSTKKYISMLNYACEDGRVRGLFQYMGANRTGRWAGRGPQPQNLTKNKILDLVNAREMVKLGNTDDIELLYGDVGSILSQLVRTTFIAKPGHTFVVPDFSAIEARVIAWFADESWRLEVFRGHGKIYEASASMMFNVPIEKVTKGSDYRSRAKVAELALGYQGSIGAMKTMGGEKMGLSESEMKGIVAKWRKASPNIVKFWAGAEKYMKKALLRKTVIDSPYKGIRFSYDGTTLFIHLPSGRFIAYREPSMTKNKWDRPSIRYKGVVQSINKWDYIDTYGGKIVENIVQGFARDILAYAMQRLTEEGYGVVLHVHDEVACEVPLDQAEETLTAMNRIMSEDISWAPGLLMNTEGYISSFYKKDD